MKVMRDYINELHKSEGYDIFIITRHLNVTKFIVDKNYKDLIKLINNYEIYIDKLPRGSTFTSTKAKNFRSEFLRLLINYTSSIYALEENIEHFFRWTEEKEATSVVNNNLKVLQSLEQFLQSPERLFIFAIRNYMQHSKILNVANSMSLLEKKDESKGQFLIKKSDITRDLNNSYSFFLINTNSRRILLNHIKINYISYSINLKHVLIAGQKRQDKLWEGILKIISSEYGDILVDTQKIQSNMMRLQRKTLKK